MQIGLPQACQLMASGPDYALPLMPTHCRSAVLALPCGGVSSLAPDTSPPPPPTQCRSAMLYHMVGSLASRLTPDAHPSPPTPPNAGVLCCITWWGLWPLDSPQIHTPPLPLHPMQECYAVSHGGVSGLQTHPRYTPLPSHSTQCRSAMLYHMVGSLASRLTPDTHPSPPTPPNAGVLCCITWWGLSPPDSPQIHTPPLPLHPMQECYAVSHGGVSRLQTHPRCTPLPSHSTQCRSAMLYHMVGSLASRLTPDTHPSPPTPPNAGVLCCITWWGLSPPDSPQMHTPPLPLHPMQECYAVSHGGVSRLQTHPRYTPDVTAGTSYGQ